uniref:Uncharacterized protein n=1 Tax=Populus trichocarpa TaxID=3694 RepID=A0A2K1WTK2_POPTR
MVGNRSVMLQGFGNNNSSKAATAGMVEHKAIAIYLNRLIRQGYCILDLTACGLGDPETTLTEVHPVCPQGGLFPPEVDFRPEHLPPNAKGLVVWITEAKVLSKEGLQFLALLPTLRPNVRVIAERGNW